jgi:anti-anti-sigma regulatory factor
MLDEPVVQIDANPDRTTTVRIAGEVSAATEAALWGTLGTIGGTGVLIVDLTHVTHLDNACVALLIELAGERGLEVVMGPGCAVYPVVQVCGLCQEATVQCR